MCLFEQNRKYPRALVSISSVYILKKNCLITIYLKEIRTVNRISVCVFCVLLVRSYLLFMYVIFSLSLFSSHFVFFFWTTSKQLDVAYHWICFLANKCVRVYVCVLFFLLLLCVCENVYV